MAELWLNYIAEIRSADPMIVYCEPGEVLKGCLAEISTALAAEVPVYCVGRCSSVVADQINDASFHYHPLWQWAETIDQAIGEFESRSGGYH